MPQDAYIQQTINQVLLNYPFSSRIEIRDSVACHRSSLGSLRRVSMLYSDTFSRPPIAQVANTNFHCRQPWSHRNISEATHSQLHNFLSVTYTASLHHLVYMGVHGRVSGLHNTSVVTPQNIAQLEGVPICLFSCAENDVYNSEWTSTNLGEANSGVCYERQVFKARGHLDP